MANQRQFEKLKEGPSAWNTWRGQQNSDLEIDLSGITLLSGNLVGANLRNANPAKAALVDTDLTNADLQNASLPMANLSHAKLIGANLENSNLTNAKLDNTDLKGATLLNANLTDASISKAKNVSDQSFSASLSADSEQQATAAQATSASGGVISYNPVLTLSVASLLSQLDEYIEKLRGDNELNVKYPELLDFLRNLKAELTVLLQAISDSKESVEIGHSIQTWKGKYWQSMNEEFGKYTDAESIAKATIPSGINLSFSALGGIIGGPIGFGAGGVVGKMFIGAAKPDALMKTVEDAINANPEK